MGYADNGVEPGPPRDDLPDASKLEGPYISARRPHHGFLKLYGFLGFLRVEALDANTLRVSLGDQSGQYTQTQPYLFARTSADGPFFENNFDKIYFEMKDGRVFRVSGDFTPLPAGIGGRRIWSGLTLVSGLALVVNSLILIVRMLGDNYRSFSEVRLQLILNYPFALLGSAAIVVCVLKYSRTRAGRARRVFHRTILLMLVVLLYILIKWAFIQPLFLL